MTSWEVDRLIELSERFGDVLTILDPKEQVFIKDGKEWRAKIQRVPGPMRERVDYAMFYTPKMITVGPIHRRIGYLDLDYKVMLASSYLQETNQSPLDLIVRILNDFQELKQRFDGDFDGYSRDDDLIWILLRDGCSLLQVLDKSNSPDVEEALQLSFDQLVRVHQDLLLLENQIPFQVLKLLCNDQAKLNKCMDNFLDIHWISGKLDVYREKENTTFGQVSVTVTVVEEDGPVHLLDYLRRAILRNSYEGGKVHKKDSKGRRRSLHLRKYRIGSIRELMAAGIRVKKNPHNTSFHPDFVAGQLLLPELTVDGSTALLFFNLVAYEMCPDFRNDFEISSFIVFLSSLIEQPEDVKELRYAGILRNELASDKEVADLFNKMDVILVPETERYASIVSQIEAYIQSRRGKIKILGWVREAYNTYFRSPWTIIALLAAAFGLTLTFIQTWYAIHPKGS